MKIIQIKKKKEKKKIKNRNNIIKRYKSRKMKMIKFQEN